MKEDLINQKIRAELNNLPIDTEARVMYLLVQIRKVLEHDTINNTLLSFYGDWVVHTKLDRKFARQVLKEVADENSEFGHHIRSFRLIKGEMANFFQKYYLPTDLVDNHWEMFRDKLLEILIDIPILSDQGDKEFSFFKGDNLGGIQYRIMENGNYRTLGRVWV